MDNTLSDLMTQRHEAYVAAKATGFEPCAETAAWRRANHAYVTARTAGTTPVNQSRTEGVPCRRVWVPRPRSRRRLATVLLRHFPPAERFQTMPCVSDPKLRDRVTRSTR